MPSVVNKGGLGCRYATNGPESGLDPTQLCVLIGGLRHAFGSCGRDSDLLHGSQPLTGRIRAYCL